ncbi:MAG TPA: PilZ domain-containing protein [Pseudolabrys sp.]|jgi:PilZ domain-containing protein|nr:PilZ domain-containing protein [Pseudolabrys sp.]
MRGDKRKARRHRLRRNAWVLLEAGQRSECVITNISDRGAHISIADSDALPDSFVLLLAENGATRRRCRVIWRKPRETGIKFDSWLDEKIRAGVKPKVDTGTAKESKEAEKV